MKIELRIPTLEDKEGLKAVCNAVDEENGIEFWYAREFDGTA